MLARRIMRFELGAADGLHGGIELFGLGQMGDVAGINHEGGPRRQLADLVDRFIQSGERIRVGRLLEADMAV